jgi:GAF domain
MERYSILDPEPGTPQAPSLPVRQSSTDLEFPGEDNGESLASWARRDLEATLQLLADRAQYITGGSGAAIALRDGDHIICRASSGPSAPEVGSYLQVSSGLSGESVRTRKTLRCDDAASDPRVNHESCRALGIASFAVMPLLRKGEVVGILEIFSAHPHSFNERDLLALERMGEMVNTALDQVGDTTPDGGIAALEAQSILFQSEPAEPGRTTAPAPPIAAARTVRAEPVSRAAVTEPKSAAAAIATPGYTPSFSQPKIQAPVLHFTTPAPAAPEAGRVVNTSSDHAIHTCSACGFPVSAGRKLCLDCEAKLPPNQFASTSGTPAFLDGLAEESKHTGLKHWISKNRYLIGTVLFAGATITLLLLR